MKTKSLSEILRKAAPPPAPEAIPHVFTEHTNFDIHVHDRGLEEVFVGMPNPYFPDQRLLFLVPRGTSQEAVGARAISYGRLLANSEEVIDDKTVSLMEERGVHQTWGLAIEESVAADLLISRNVQEVRHRHVPLLDHKALKTFEIGQWMLRLSRTANTEVFQDLLRRELFLRYGEQGTEAVATLHKISKVLLPIAQMGGDLTRAALQLQEIFGSPEQEPTLEPPPSEKTGSGKAKTNGDHSSVGTPILTWQDGVPIAVRPEYSSVGAWCDMKIVHPPLIATRKTQKLAKKWRRGMVGAFRYPWRALRTSDGYAFAIRRKVPKGTILIDCSSSMGISRDQIETIVEHTPHVKVACYGGFDPAAGLGHLVIAAEEGKMADMGNMRKYFNGGNDVDGPALAWLATQEGPRVWVSDEQVCSARGNAEWMWPQCDAICKGADIARIKSATELIELLRT